MKASRKAACSTPAIGLAAPARTLVAVRAIVPVTQMPPKKLDATLATPCATSSILERCLRPLMPSATLADSRLSTAPSSANEIADGNTASIRLGDSGGGAGAGRPLGIAPNRAPIVAIG